MLRTCDRCNSAVAADYGKEVCVGGLGNPYDDFMYDYFFCKLCVLQVFGEHTVRKWFGDDA